MKDINVINLKYLLLKSLPVLSDVIVIGDFLCYNNQLPSLKGAPKYVVGDFYCDNNKVKFTEEYVRSIVDVKGFVYL